MKSRVPRLGLCLAAALLAVPFAHAQIGRRFPSEKKVVPDPVTGIPLTFLTSTQAGDSKIYQTHPQWTSDGQWVIFRSRRVPGQAMAVNEQTGDIVQVTEGGYSGMLCIARKSMKLYLMRDPLAKPGMEREGPPPGSPPPAGMGKEPEKVTAAEQRERAMKRPHNPMQIVEVDLAKLFADSAAGTLKKADAYEHVLATVPGELWPGGDMALDADEQVAYVRIESPSLADKLPPGTKLEENFGPRNMGAGPSGLLAIDLQTGANKLVTVVPFKIGHVQTNPWVKGEIIFCWETGGKSPQRTWVVNADGSGLRPLYPEAGYEWITHEAVITKDEVALAILAHRKPGVGLGDKPDPWGPSGSGEHPTGVGIINLRTREMRIVGQVPMGDPGLSVWHVNGSADGRWAVADDFMYRVWLIDRHTGEMMLLADDGHMKTAADHQHPTFNADGTKIEVQSAMLSADHRSMNICVIPVPKSWLARKYDNPRLQD